MKKKLVAGLLTGAMMAALLTGCAGSGSDKSSDATVCRAWFLR